MEMGGESVHTKMEAVYTFLGGGLGWVVTFGGLGGEVPGDVAWLVM